MPLGDNAPLKKVDSVSKSFSLPLATGVASSLLSFWMLLWIYEQSTATFLVVIILPYLFLGLVVYPMVWYFVSKAALHRSVGLKWSAVGSMIPTFAISAVVVALWFFLMLLGALLGGCPSC